MMFLSGGPAVRRTTTRTWPDLTGGNHDAINAVGRAGERGTSNDGSRPERGRAQERPQDACRRVDLRHGLQPPALQPAHADQQAERQAAGAGVVLQPRRQPRPGSAAAAQGRGDLSHRPRKDGGRRCDDRQGNLEGDDRISAGDHTRGMLRHRQPWRRAARRQALSHHARRQRDCPRRQDRQGALAHQDGGPQGRLFHDRRAAGRQRRGHRRRLRGRVRTPRLSRRFRSANRQVAVAHLHDPGAGRAGRADLAEPLEPDRWRFDLDHRLLRSRARSRVLGHRQSGAVEPAQSSGRQSRLEYHLRLQAADRKDRMVLPDHARRSVRL
jgi:hypothetical protein